MDLEWTPAPVAGYELSPHGLVRNRQGKVLKPFSDSKGYQQVELKGTKYLMHRLIAEAFVRGKSDIHNQINHIDGDRRNNAADNLERCDQSHNMKHAFRTGLASKKSPRKMNAWKRRVASRAVAIPGLSDEYIASALGVSSAAVWSIRHNYHG